MHWRRYSPLWRLIRCGRPTSAGGLSIVTIWRQLFVGKGLVGKRSAKDLAAAALVPMWKAGDFAAGCKKFESKQLAAGFRLLLQADRAFKTSTPNPEGYFDVMLWKLIG